MKKLLSKRIANALTVPAVLFGVPLIVFYFAIGPEVIYATDLWLLMAACYLLFGGLALVIKLTFDNACPEEKPQLSKVEIHEGKWRFAGKWTLIVAALVTPTLALSYAMTERKAEDGTATIAFILLMIIAIAGAFFISLETWKLRQRLRQKPDRGTADRAETRPSGSVPIRQKPDR